MINTRQRSSDFSRSHSHLSDRVRIWKDAIWLQVCSLKPYTPLPLGNNSFYLIGSVPFSPSVMSDSLWHHWLQHTRLPCPSPTPELPQNHVHWVSNAMQPSHPLLSPSPPAFNLSQHQGLFKWVSSSHQWPKYWSFSFSICPSNEYSGLFLLGWTDWISLQSKGLSRVFSNTTVQKHQFFGAQLSL